MNKPKLDLLLDKPIKLTLLKDKPYIGQNNYGEFYLYSAKDENGVEYSYFADASIHNLIQEHKLKAGSSFVLQRVAAMNGKKMSSKVEFSIIGEPEPQHSTEPMHLDGLKTVMQQSIKDALELIKSFPEVPFQSEDIRSISLTLFIQRARNA
jgi:hypothetical protein